MHRGDCGADAPESPSSSSPSLLLLGLFVGVSA